MLRGFDYLYIEKTTGFLQDLSTIRAGEEIRETGPKYRGCSLGWNVVKYDSYEIGQSTAGHCQNKMRHVKTGSNLVYKSGINKGSIDLQWHQQKKTDKPIRTANYFLDGNTPRKIKGKKTLIIY